VNKYIKVTLGLPIDKLFHYAAPTHLQDDVAIGKRVLVPFGGRQITGYIVGFTEGPARGKIKDITEILDPEPVLSPRRLKLTKWIADYYLASWGQVIEATLPTGPKVESKKIVRLNASELARVIPEIEKKSANQAQVLRMLEARKEMSFRELERRMKKGAAYSAVRALEKKGLVTSKLVLKEKGSKAKSIRIVKAKEIPKERWEDLEKKAPKQTQVLEILKESKKELTSSQLAKVAGTSISTIKSLEKKGFVEYLSKEIRRRVKKSEGVERELQKLSEPQLGAFKEIRRSIGEKKKEVILLQGARGSGRERLYLEAIGYSLSQGRGVILLYPEVKYAVRAFGLLESYLGDRVGILYSTLSPGVRYDEWRRIKEGVVDVVVGIRSAVFAPVKDLGLIIIDGEEETSYKQEETPRYHTRQVALEIAEESQATVILTSGSPTLESYYEVKSGKYCLLKLSQAQPNSKLPKVKLIDMRLELTEKKNRSIFSLELQEAIEMRLERKEQVILFLNRRGFASFVLCRQCGLVLHCPNCNLSLTYHSPQGTLHCHHCNYSLHTPDICPKCRGHYMKSFGIGTQKVEEEAGKFFPGARVVRMDVDTTGKKGSYERIVNLFRDGGADILVGTQMVIQGLDFKGRVLVGVVSADTALNLPDFRATERTFTLLSQVMGRTGRGSVPDEVIIQTYTPEHYGIKEACFGDYDSFYAREIKYRKELSYPPFTHLINVVIRSDRENQAQRVASRLSENLVKIKKRRTFRILGPSPAPFFKVKGQYRWQVALKGENIKELQEVLRPALEEGKSFSNYRNISISIDVDPVALF
jgi:primosomal protein N' (replication factor Y)